MRLSDVEEKGFSLPKGKIVKLRCRGQNEEFKNFALFTRMKVKSGRKNYFTKKCEKAGAP